MADHLRAPHVFRPGSRPGSHFVGQHVAGHLQLRLLHVHLSNHRGQRRFQHHSNPLLPRYLQNGPGGASELGVAALGQNSEVSQGIEG